MQTTMTALPVMLHLAGRHADGLRRWVEGVLGWQAIDSETAGLVPPALEICDIGAAGDLGTAPVPRLLVVADDDPPEVAAAAAAVLRPHATVAWPSGRERLSELAEHAVSSRRPVTSAVRRLRIGGSAGGVGTTTVALGIGGLAGWSGSGTLVVVRGAGLSFRELPSAALSGPDVWGRADELAGLSETRVVRAADATSAPELTDPRVGVLVEDRGVEVDVDLLVCRRDAAGLAALELTTAAVVVVVGDGPVGVDQLRRAADGRRALAMPWSARVARAGLAGRVPAGLPGAWLRRLRPLVPTSVPPDPARASIRAGAGREQVFPRVDRTREESSGRRS